MSGMYEQRTRLLISREELFNDDGANKWMLGNGRSRRRVSTGPRQDYYRASKAFLYWLIAFCICEQPASVCGYGNQPDRAWE
jgi:hypothetical protein